MALCLFALSLPQPDLNTLLCSVCTGLHQYDGNASFFSSTETILSQARSASSITAPSAMLPGRTLAGYCSAQQTGHHAECIISSKLYVSSNTLGMLQGVGYGILVGFGAFFALICSGLAYFDVTFGGHKDSSEHFQTASRNIKTGLIAGAEPVMCSSI